jgi:hypothetical protein
LATVGKLAKFLPIKKNAGSNKPKKTQLKNPSTIQI